jgi:hypothetical protein
MKPGAETVAGCAPNSEITANISQMRRCSFGHDAARTPGTQRYRMQLIAGKNSQRRRMRQAPTPLAQARPGISQSELCRQPL